MKSSLNQIQGWESLADSVAYSVTLLARHCGVSCRQLQRFMLLKFGESPHKWLHELRLRRAVELILGGRTIKETAHLLAYRDRAHFEHDFKRYYGISPRNFQIGRCRILTYINPCISAL